MKIKDLKLQLNKFDEENEVCAAIFKKDNTAEISGIDCVCDNEGNAQINVEVL